MKNQKLSHVALQCAMLCVCLLALTAAAAVVNAQGKTKGKVVKAGDLGVASKSNTESSTASAEVDPKIVKGLEAAAAARKGEGQFQAGNLTKNVDSSLVLALFTDANKLTSVEVNRGAEIGVIYIGKGSKELTPGYYYVQLIQQPASAELIYKVTLIPAQTGGAAERRQYQPLLIRKRFDKDSSAMKSGAGRLDLNTLGGDIMGAVEQSIVNTTKSNIKDY